MTKTRGKKAKKTKKPARTKGAVAVLGAETSPLVENQVGQTGQKTVEGEVLDERESTILAKKRFLEFFGANLTAVTNACIVTGVSRSQFYNWLKDDPDFKAAYLEAEEMQNDLVEQKHYDLVRNGEASQVRFHLQSRNPGRWSPKTTLVHTVGNVTLEDLIDRDNAKENAQDTTATDRGTAENPQQKEADRSLPPQQSAGVLLEPANAPQQHPQSAAEGAN